MLSFFKRLAAQVATPKPGRVTLFVGDDGVPAYKDETDAVHSLRGGQGDAGDKGDQGDPGLSAYEVWLAAGNVGTEADYLASLKGAKGDAGPEGAGVPTGGAVDAILAKQTAADRVMKWIGKATTTLAQAGTDNNSWMTPSLTAAEILSLTGFGAAPTTAAIADANTLGGSKVSRTNGSTANLPAGMAADGALLTIQTASDQAIQVWSTVREIGVSNRPALFVRGYYGATQAWGAWRRMADDSNVVHAAGDETVQGSKTWSNTQIYNGPVQFGGNVYLRWGATGTAGAIRGTGTSFVLSAGDSAEVPGTIFWRPAGSTNSATQVALSPAGMIFTLADDAKLATRRSLNLPVTISATAPASPTAGDIWIDIS